MVRVDFDRLGLDGAWTAAHKHADASPKDSMPTAAILDLSKCLLDAETISQPANQDNSEIQAVAVAAIAKDADKTDMSVKTKEKMEQMVVKVEQAAVVNSEDAGEAEMLTPQGQKDAGETEMPVPVRKADSSDCCWQGIMELFSGGRNHTHVPAVERKTVDQIYAEAAEERKTIAEANATEADESDLQRALLESAKMYEEEDTCVAQARARLQSVMDMYHVKASPIQADGNCQFRALAQQFYGDESQHQVIRTAVVKQLEAAPERYADFVQEAYTDYLKRMGRDGEWGDNVTLQAASDALASDVHILTDQPGAEYLQVHSNGKIDGTTHKSLWLTFLAEMHYEAVLPLQ